MSETKDRAISTLESGCQVSVEIDEADGNVLRLRRMIDRTRTQDLGTVVITDSGLDLSGLADRKTDWWLRNLESMGKKPLPIVR